MERTESPPNIDNGLDERRVSRRRLLVRGLGTGAGLTIAGWARPVLSTAQTGLPRGSSAPCPRKIRVSKTVASCGHERGYWFANGTISIVNLCADLVTVDGVHDQVFFLLDGHRHMATMLEFDFDPPCLVTPMGPFGACSGEYRIEFTGIPPGATRFRNRAQVKGHDGVDYADEVGFSM
jgi:hypothetical protein